MCLCEGSNYSLNHGIEGPRLWYQGCNGHGHGLYWKANVKLHNSTRLGGSSGQGKTQVRAALPVAP